MGQGAGLFQTRPLPVALRFYGRTVYVKAVTKTDDEIRKSDKEKVDIEFALEEKAKEFSSRTASHIRKLFDVFGYEEIFGRREIVALLELRNSSASKLLSKLVHSGVIEPVSGCGKGRYKFRIDNIE